MPLPAFSPCQHFIQAVLPGLIHADASLTHVVASYNRIGSRRPAMPAEILRADGLTSLLFSELTLGRIQTDVVRVVRKESDPLVPMIATVYVGGRQFVEMMQLVVLLREARPDARIVAIACPCITTDQEETVRRGIEAGKLTAAAWSDCGGTNMIRDIHRAVEKNWISDESDIQFSHHSTNSVDLGA